MFVGVKCHSHKEAWADPEESGTHTPPPPENSNSLSNVEEEIFVEDLILLF